MSTAYPRTLESSRDGSSAAPASHSDVASTRGVLRSLAQLLGSNALISLTGLICLPVLFRNLGAATYGQFSLFLLALGLISSLDIARPTLVLELSGKAQSPAEKLSELRPLIGISQCWLAPLALIAGSWIFGWASGLALGIGVALFVAASSPYASLAAQGRVGVAAATRNLAWVAAFITTAVLSFFELPAHLYFWPFALANLAILLVNRRLAGPGSDPFLVRPRLAPLRLFRQRSLDILGLSLATAVVISADKLMLEGLVSADAFGRYAAQYDLAIKINVLSTALGTVLFPAFSRLFAQEGREVASARFVRQMSWIVLAYFFGLALILCFAKEVLSLVLGAEGLAGAPVYPLLLFGIFLALFGHLITPWQRACGDFRTHRRIYSWSAGLMILVGVFAIPAWGAVGAVVTYLSARSADLLLILSEVRRTSREVLGTARLLALASMILLLGALAAFQFIQLGGVA